MGKMFGGFKAGTNTFDESALFLEVIGNFFSVEHDGSVEVGKEDDESEVDCGVDKPLSGYAVRVEGREIRGGRSGEERD